MGFGTGGSLGPSDPRAFRVVPSGGAVAPNAGSREFARLQGAADVARLNPLDPTMSDMIGSFLENGGRILVCLPCAKVRGYSEESLIEGATVEGAPVMLEKINAGAATLSF